MNINLRLAILQTTRTQIRLSAATGIGETRLSRIVNGWAKPRADEKDRIAGAVGMPVRALFEEERLTNQ